MGKGEEIAQDTLERGVDTIYPSRETLEQVLRVKRRLIVYHGIDPTGPQLHLGHSTNLFILRRFQQLGHKVVVLIGDLTAQIGDPTDKLAPRKPLTAQQVRAYARTYRKQIARLLSLSGKNPARIVFNSTWYRRFTVTDVLSLAQRVTVQRLLERDMFQKRMREGKPIGTHEFLYPLFQGYDSVALHADVEVGGTDQTFNMLMGRTLVREIEGREKCVLTTKLLENPKTGRKLMSKSEGGIIGFTDPPEDIYGKVMALSDEVVIPCFTLCTLLPQEEIFSIEQQLKKGANPRDLKMRLAREVVALYHGAGAAAKAQAGFVSVFQKKETPANMPERTLPGSKWDPVELLLTLKLVPSKSEARRLIQQRGARLDGRELSGERMVVKDGAVLQLGKRRFVRLRVAVRR